MLVGDVDGGQTLRMPSADARTELHVNRRSFGETRLVTSPLAPLAPGHVRVDIERYALTANNITYAQFGDMLAYWDFYPVFGDDRPTWGHVPCMGWGRITESNVDAIAAGERYYGWWPMATSVDIAATPTGEGFRDDGDHRSPHAPAYRAFQRTDRDPMYTSADDEPRHSLLRGLFLTGFLAEAFFDSREQFGADQTLVLSASSKTAIAYADCAHRRGAVRVVGLTSSGNVDFVRGLGCYDDVLTYDDVDQVALAPSTIVDMAGAGAVVAALHERLGDRIGHSMVVGKSHHDAPPVAVPAGPNPEMFFAPGEIQTRLKEWGPEGYRSRVVDALGAFIAGSRDWLQVAEHLGTDEAAAAWAAVYAGTVPPNEGTIVSLHAAD
ncbi:MAG: hypothetical protein RL238_3665 [Actinomycetota bacterium]